jgi:hypothetical protein
LKEMHNNWMWNEWKTIANKKFLFQFFSSMNLNLIYIIYNNMFLNNIVFAERKSKKIPNHINLLAFIWKKPILSSAIISIS